MPKAPKEQNQNDPAQGAPFPDIDFDDTGLEQPGNGPTDNKTVTVDWAAKYAELEGRLNSLQEERNLLLAKPLVNVPPQPPQPMSFDGLPDAALDQVAHDRALVERLNEHNRAVAAFEAQVQGQGQSREQRYDAIWDDFSVEYEDYAEDQSKAEFAASKVLARAQKKGIDIDNYALNHTAKFMKDVAAEMDSIFGAPNGETAPNMDINPKQAPRARASRTDGMLGGGEGGNKPAKATAGNPNDMGQVIRKFQLDYGFH